MINTKVISGFPGIGKSYYKKNATKNVIDSDSSKFSWLKPGVRNPDFPQNYICHIKENIGKVDVILVSSHKVVREALVDSQIPFILVYPPIALKKEYISRFEQRGSNREFIDMLSKNWNSFIKELNAQIKCEHIILPKGKYLSDCID